MSAFRGPRDIRPKRSRSPEGSRDYRGRAPEPWSSRGEATYERSQQERFGLRQRVKAAEQEVEEMAMRLNMAEKRERAMRSEIAALEKARVADKDAKYGLREELRSLRRDNDRLQKENEVLKSRREELESSDSSSSRSEKDVSAEKRSSG